MDGHVQAWLRWVNGRLADDDGITQIEAEALVDADWVDSQSLRGCRELAHVAGRGLVRRRLWYLV